MKTIAIAIIIFTGIALSSCQKTNKDTSKNPDTMVIKKDTAIKRTDTAGFKK